MSSSVNLDEHWHDLRQQVEAALDRCLDDLSAECPDLLREAMRYSLMAGGKRLRPVMVLMACEACGGKIEAAMPAACAIEMIHTYSLIHDDLPAMDDDDLRRGRPTSHRQFDEATAILAGDGLLTLAFEALTRVQPPEVVAACVADLASSAGSEGMVAGQVADLQAEKDSESGGGPSLKQLEGIHLRKTGRLLRSALTLGARIALAPPEFVEFLKIFQQNPLCLKP